MKRMQGTPRLPYALLVCPCIPEQVRGFINERGEILYYGAGFRTVVTGKFDERSIVGYRPSLPGFPWLREKLHISSRRGGQRGEDGNDGSE